MKAIKNYLITIIVLTLTTTSSFTETISEEGPSSRVSEISLENIEKSCIQDGVVVSKTMTWKQRKQLYVEGKITDCNGQIWNIRIIPGVNKSKEFIIDAYKDAAEVSSALFEKETYTEMNTAIGSASEFGWTFTKNTSKHILYGADRIFVKGVYGTFIMKTIEGYQKGWSNSEEIEGDMISTSILKANEIALKPTGKFIFNTLKTFAWDVPLGALQTAYGLVTSAFGVAYTVTTPFTTPILDIIGRPLFSLGLIVTKGTLAPSMIFVWNNGAWLSSQFNKTPTKEVYTKGINWVRLENPAKINRRISRQEFINVLQVAIEKNILDRKVAEDLKEVDKLQVKINQLEDGIEQLKGEKNIILSKIIEEHDEFKKMAIYQSLMELNIQIREADSITHEKEVKEIVINDEQLKILILDYAMSIREHLDDNQVEKIISTVKEDFNMQYKEN